MALCRGFVVLSLSFSYFGDTIKRNEEDLQAESRVVTRSERKGNKPVSFNEMCLRLEILTLIFAVK